MALAALLVLGVAVRTHRARQAAQELAFRTYLKVNSAADEAVSALQAIQSATSVGVTSAVYKQKVIDAKTKVDLFVSRYGEYSYSSYGTRLLAALKPYITADAIWEYQRSEDCELIPNTAEVYAECEEEFPEIMKGGDDDGILVDGSMSPDCAIQALWSLGTARAERLRFPAFKQE